MKEKDITPAVLASIKANWHYSCAIEIKLCRTEAMQFSVVAEHQALALWHAKHKRLMFKIPDMGYQNPMDAFMLVRSKAYLVVVFWKPRELKEAYAIDIDMWLKEVKTSKRRSLTRQRAGEIGFPLSL